MREVLSRIWSRATATQPAPEPAVVAAVALVALALVVLPRAWSLTRHLVTISHEGGHALVAVLTGRRLMGIRLHADTSGVTLSRGRPTGPGMVAMLAAGYLAPAVAGLAAALLLAAGHSLALLWLAVAYLLSAGPAMYVLDVGGMPVDESTARTLWQSAYGPADRLLSASPLAHR